MPVVIISGTALAFASNPHSDTPVDDSATLARLHGVYADDICSQYLTAPELKNLTSSGGRVRIIYCQEDNSLRVTTAYDVSREPNELEKSALIEETTAQWSDGIGCGSFSNYNCRVLSTALAMALRNAGHTHVGELFVDVYPIMDDQGILFEFIEHGHSDDELVSDLIQNADVGNLSAMTALGQRYQSGEGVEQDSRLAFELYNQAAERGDPLAITLMGICYEKGIGCGLDKSKAIKTFEMAAELHFPLAMHCLGEMYEDENPKESVALYMRGAALGDPGCLAQLGDCYEYGKGVDLNLDEAIACYRRCIELGFDAVSEAIKRIESSQSR